MRFGTIGSTIVCILICAGAPLSADAATGGVSVGGSAAMTTPGAPAGGATPTEPAKKSHTAPVISHSRSLAYKGPVFQKTATGEVIPYLAPQSPGAVKSMTGGSPVVGAAANTRPELLVPGHTARVINGLAAAPLDAPPSVQSIVWAGNQIIGLPYVYGGGHASFISSGYDCSGTVSFALHGASLLSTPEDSSEFMGWGSHGVGAWVTVFSNPGHAYMTVAGLRLDTSAADDPSDQQGPRWRPLRPGNGGYTVRHPVSL